jgi:DNA-binding transcriptional LysR family regulator
LRSSSPSPIATRTSRAATRTSLSVWFVRPKADLSRAASAAARIGLYARRDYCDRFGSPRSLADLPHHCVIGYDRDSRTFRSAGAIAKELTRADFGFRCDSDLAQLAALRAGVGVGGRQEAIARRSKDLIPILPGVFQMTLEIWLVMHLDLKSAPRVRLLFDWLAEGLSDYVKGKTSGASE